MLLFLSYLRHSRLGQSGWKQDEKTARHVSRTLQSVSEASQGLSGDSVMPAQGSGTVSALDAEDRRATSLR